MNRSLLILSLILVVGVARAQFSLVGTSPQGNRSAVPINSTITLEFSDVVDPMSVETGVSIISSLAGVIEHGTTVSGNLVTLTPTSAFLRSDIITVTIFPTLESVGEVALAAPAVFQFNIETGPSNVVPPIFADSDIELTGETVVQWIGRADLDKDGDVDIIYTGSQVGWLENNGSAEFTTHNFPLNSNGLGGLIPCDIDSDGDMDMLTSVTLGGIKILINDGAQSFSMSPTVSGSSVYSMDIADFDYNGLPDIVYSGSEIVNDTFVDGTYILYNRGAGVFDRVKIGQSNYGNRCVDIDNDGDLDIVHLAAQHLSYLLNDDTTFTYHDISIGAPTFILGVKLANLNDDRFVDLIVSSYKSSTTYTEVWVSDGNLIFHPETVDSVSNLESPTSADFDGDGDQDILARDGSHIFTMLVNDGAANFVRKQVAFDPLDSPPNVIHADFDSDGDLDFAVLAFNVVKFYENSILPFMERTPLTPQELTDGDSDWGDFDNDGDFDLVVTGVFTGNEPNLIATVYENIHGDFQPHSSLKGLFRASCDWGDYDNDGDLDILMAGASDMNNDNPKPICHIYTNQNGSFVPLESSLLQLPKIYSGEARWADFDNDGWLDIAMSAEGISAIYRSDGHGNFFMAYSFPLAFQKGNLDVGDCDGDGDVDIAMSGYGGILDVFRNEGNWSFSSFDADLAGRSGGNLDFVDMDNDGDYDLVVGRPLNSYGSLTVYENQDSLFRSVENTELLQLEDYEGAIVSGDYDNDGISDVLASRRSYPPIFRILKNGGHGDLKIQDITLPAIATKAANWIDYDNDHDLDIFEGGMLVRNNVAAPNSPPQPPAQFRSDSVFNNSIFLSWDKGGDMETGASGLSYQIYVGKQPHMQDVVNASSVLSTGLRKLATPGNAKGLKTRVTNLEGGHYYYGIQSIDGAFEGSTFTEEQEIFVIGIHGPVATCKGFEHPYVAKPAGEYTWEVIGGTIMSGQGSDSLVVKWDSVGRRYVKIRNGQDDRNSLEVHVDLKPIPEIMGDSTVCTDEQLYEVVDSLSFSTVWTVEAVNEIYTLNKNRVKVPWPESGDYSVISQSFPEHFGCSTYDTLRVSVDERPPVPSIVGPDMSCANGIKPYTTESSNPVWTTVNGSINVNDGQSIQVEWQSSEIMGSLYVLEKSVRAFCESVDSLQVTIHPLPETPTLHWHYDSLSASYDSLLSSPSPNGFYMWYNNELLVMSGLDVAGIPNAPGDFVVEVFNLYGCGSKSNPFHIIITGIDNVHLESTFAFYPNPADTRLFFDLTDPYMGECSAEIYSVTGQLVKQFTSIKVDQMLSGEIDVSGLDAGVYILNINTQDATRKRKIVIR